MNFFEQKLGEVFTERFEVKYESGNFVIKFLNRVSYPEIWYSATEDRIALYKMKEGGVVIYQKIRDVVIEFRSLLDMYPEEKENMISPKLEPRLERLLGKKVTVTRVESSIRVQADGVDLTVCGGRVFGNATVRDKRKILRALQDEVSFSYEIEIETGTHFRPGDIVANGLVTKYIIGTDDDKYKSIMLRHGCVSGYSFCEYDNILWAEQNYTLIGHFDNIELVKQNLLDMIQGHATPMKLVTSYGNGVV